MKHAAHRPKTLHILLALSLLFLPLQSLLAQTSIDHTVKKKETLFGIARTYGLSTQQLVEANPVMNTPGYQLKKGDVIKIPVAAKPIRLGVMLPLHDDNGDGRRMVEYYRGVLMACDSMKHEGVSVEVYAWNLAEDGDIAPLLGDPSASQLDIIIGPLYSKFMQPLSDFAKKHDIMLVPPFSINAPQIEKNKHIFQVYQSAASVEEAAARRCAALFSDCHPVIVDCHDSTSTKAPFTAALRKEYEQRGVAYNVTSLTTAEESFAKAFTSEKPNLVVLNTSRSKDLLATFALLKRLTATRPGLQISMMGYTEWLMYADKQAENFHRFDVNVPSHFFTNTASPTTTLLDCRYETFFGQKMQQDALPRFALTGFDHAVFFLRGLKKYGKTFDGAAGRFGYPPVQTPLRFEKVGKNGGYQNRAFMFIHYKRNGNIDTVNY